MKSTTFTAKSHGPSVFYLELATVSMGLLLLACCANGGEGSGDGGSDSDAGAPVVSSTSPADEAKSVERAGVITATFSKDMLHTSLHEMSFALARSGGDNISGSVSFDSENNIASFTPDGPLAINASYTASLDTTIVDLSGNALARTHNWSFTTAGGAWAQAVVIETNDRGNAKNPQVVFDDDGSALVVWEQGTGGRDTISANRFDGTNWGSSTLISFGVSNAGAPQIAIGNDGNALAVWQQSNSIWANRYDGTNWRTAQRIETDDSGSARAPQIAMDNRGNALAVWSQSDESRSNSNIWANRFDGTNWGSAQLIGADDLGDAINPQIAFNGSGSAQAVWAQFDGDHYNIIANQFDGTSWGTPEPIETSDAGGASNPQIAFDNNGNGLAVWGQRQDNGTLREDIWANRFDGTRWGNAELIENEAGDTGYPHIAIDNRGNALAVWKQLDSNGQDNIWSNHFDGARWGNAELIEAVDVGGSTSSPKVAFDKSGNALAVWTQETGNFYDVWANRFDGANWGTAQKIETEDAGSAGHVQIAIDNNGNGLAVWSRADGFQSNQNIWANRFE